MKRHLQLSEEFLDDSRAFLEQRRLRSALDRAYYAIHYSAVAMLCSLGIRPPRSHSGLIGVFGREAVGRGVIRREFGRMLNLAFQKRSASTYSADGDIMLKDAQEVVADAEQFVSEARSILNL